MREIDAEEVAKYTVVRVADEIVIDLMHKACEVTYDHVAYHIVANIRIPFLKPELLLKTKMTIRAKDAEDRFFLEQLLKSPNDENLPSPQITPAVFPSPLQRFLNKMREFFLRARS